MGDQLQQNVTFSIGSIGIVDKINEKYGLIAQMKSEINEFNAGNLEAAKLHAHFLEKNGYC